VNFLFMYTKLLVNKLIDVDCEEFVLFIYAKKNPSVSEYLTNLNYSILQVKNICIYLIILSNLDAFHMPHD